MPRPARPGRPNPGPIRPKVEPSKKFTDDERDQARSEIERAFAIVNSIVDGRPACPACGANKKGKVKLFKDGGWRCHACTKGGDAIGLLVEYGHYTFPDAVNTLLGRPTRASATPIVVPEYKLAKADSFQAVVDCEVYETLVAAGSVAEAQRYYGRFHIPAEIVAEAGAVVIEDPKAVSDMLLAKYGKDRLLACGLFMPGEDGKADFAICNRNYPVIEPHHRPDGRIVGMQFRASYAQERKILAHKAYSKARDAARAAGTEYTGTKVEYVPKFLSLRGGVPGKHIVGCGLHRLATLRPGTRVLIVEGFKDRMGARALGTEAYAIPGVGAMPPEKVCMLLKRFDVELSMDADEGGERGTAALKAHFDAHGVPWKLKSPPLPAGMDVTDVLVDRHARRGCTCATCTAWRSSHAA